MLRLIESGFSGLAGSAEENATLRERHGGGLGTFVERLVDYIASAKASVLTTSTARKSDALWAAVGDPTRRQLLDTLLARGEASATSLATELPVTRQAVAKHLAVLDRAGLVAAEKVGREADLRRAHRRARRGQPGDGEGGGGLGPAPGADQGPC